MLIAVGTILIIAVLLLTGFAFWRGEMRVRTFGVLNGAAMLAGLVIASLPRVESFALHLGQNQSVNVQMQKIEQTAKRVDTSAQQVQTDTAEVRQMKEQIEALLKRVEESENTIAKTNNSVEQTDRKLAIVEKRQEQRAFSPKQRQDLIKDLSPFRGQFVSVSCILGDTEGETFARDIASVLDQAGWKFGDGKPEVTQVVYNGNPSGIEVTVNEDDVYTNRIPPATEILINYFAQWKMSKLQGFKNPQVPTGKIEIRVGRKLSLQ